MSFFHTSSPEHPELVQPSQTGLPEYEYEVQWVIDDWWLECSPSNSSNPTCPPRRPSKSSPGIAPGCAWIFIWRLMRQRLIICFCYKPSNPLNPSKLTSPPNCLARPSKTGTAFGFAWKNENELKTLPPTPPLCSIFLKRPGSQEARSVGEVQGGLQAAAEKEALLLVQTSFPFASSSFPHLKALSKKLTWLEQNSDRYLQSGGWEVRLIGRGERKWHINNQHFENIGSYHVGCGVVV